MDLNLRPLGYEPYDARLRRLAWSLIAALISVNGHGASTPDLGVSRVAPYPATSRAQIRAQIWLLPRGITVVAIASVSGIVGSVRQCSVAGPAPIYVSVADREAPWGCFIGHVAGMTI
jgi:hypothetical protein